jgi:hypothetical protein
MPLRNFNPFKKALTAHEIYEQNNNIRTSTDKGFQDASVKGSPPIEIKEPAEYKLSGMRPGSNTWVVDSSMCERAADIPQRLMIAASIYR